MLENRPFMNLLGIGKLSFISAFICWSSLFIFILSGCVTEANTLSKIGGGDNCKLEDYTPALESPFILPYKVGKAYAIGAGNCGGGSHNVNCDWMAFPCGDQRYAYDINMSPGTPLVAVSDGVVVSLDERHPNIHDTGDKTNYLLIEHSDGTAAQYVHLSPDGVLVEVGDQVEQGEVIAKSGASGHVGLIPHLHFVIYQEVNSKCNGPVLDDCISVPVTFRNAEPPDIPLRFSKVYKALPY